MNRYQLRKARLIAAVLLTAACESDTPLAKLPELAARMSESDWRAVSFAAGVAVADVPARTMTVAILGGLA